MRRLFLALVLCLLPLAAWAQTGDQTPTGITGDPLVDKIVGYLIALTTALAPILASLIALKLKQKWNVDIDKGLRDGFQTATANAAGMLIQRLGKEAAKMTKLDPANAHVAEAIRMVKAGAGDAIDRFVITPEDIAKRLEAKIGLATGITDASGAPVVAKQPTGE